MSTEKKWKKRVARKKVLTSGKKKRNGERGISPYLDVRAPRHDTVSM